MVKINRAAEPPGDARRDRASEFALGCLIVNLLVLQRHAARLIADQ
ncbi:MAG: hypothetical protein HY331_13795 [Chloroflexi bacterium]|nr:hypothetical protein [Chloroflexota bacterium]